MDFKDFHDALLSLSLVVFMFSLTYLIGTLLLRPYVGLEPAEMWFIVFLSFINIPFSLYYLWEALRLKEIFKLEDKHIIKFAKRIGAITILYSPHYFVFLSLLFIGLHNLQFMMAGLVIFMETLLLGVVYKEVYDILYLEPKQREFEFREARERYLKDENDIVVK